MMSHGHRDWVRAVFSACAIALGGCQSGPALNPPPDDGDERIDGRGIAGQAVPDDLLLRAQLEIRWEGADGQTHLDKVDMKLWVRGSTGVACDLSSLGSRLAWVGGEGGEWWVFDKRDDGMHLTTGSTEDALASLSDESHSQRGIGDTLTMLAVPGIARALLGVTAALPECAGWQFSGAWQGGRLAADGQGALPSIFSLRAQPEAGHGRGVPFEWVCQWSGVCPVDGAGAGHGVVPATITATVEGLKGSLTMWIASSTSDSGKDAFFDAESLAAVLRPVRRHAFVAGGEDR